MTTNGLTSKEPLPLNRSEYLDCPNVCGSRSAKWYRGDAICPECGEMAVVYDRPKRKELSPTMRDCLNYANEHGGKLTRYPGGFWCESQSGKQTRPWFGTPTVEALVARGRMVYSEWMEGRTRFPIEATVSIQREDDCMITTEESHGVLSSLNLK